MTHNPPPFAHSNRCLAAALRTIAENNAEPNAIPALETPDEALEWLDNGDAICVDGGEGCQLEPLPILELGDYLRVVADGSAHDGMSGHLARVDDGALYYLATSDNGALYGPFMRWELAGVLLCRWFLACPSEAVEVVAHPVLGDVPVCGSCLKYAHPNALPIERER